MKQGKKHLRKSKVNIILLIVFIDMEKYYELYEHNIYGEETSYILVCVTDYGILTQVKL